VTVINAPREAAHTSIRRWRVPAVESRTARGELAMFARFNPHTAVVTLSALAVLFSAGAAGAQTGHTSRAFSGPKVNGGTVTHSMQGRMHLLTLSDDFKVPDTPDPHWQVIDSKGNTYLLQRLGIKGDKINKTITLPAYVVDVARVQIYCAWAEAVLGEAPFSSPMKTH
jgi:hypothetical protein